MSSSNLLYKKPSYNLDLVITEGVRVEFCHESGNVAIIDASHRMIFVPFEAYTALCVNSIDLLDGLGLKNE